MGAAGCQSCGASRVVGPVLYRVTRVRDGLTWRLVRVPVERGAACAGDYQCAPCALAAKSAAAPSSAAPMPGTRFASAVPSMSRDPAAWLATWRETMRGRSSGRVMDFGDSNFQRSTLTELRALSDGDLEARLTEFESLPSPTSEQGNELINLRAEWGRRQDASAFGTGGGTGTGTGGGVSSSETATAERNWGGMTAAEKRAAAERIAAQATRDEAQRARLVTIALTQGFAAFNRILDGEYGIVVARINAARDVELARINARGDSERLLLQSNNNQAQQPLQASVSTDASGSGLLIGLGILAALAAWKK